LPVAVAAVDNNDDHHHHHIIALEAGAGSIAFAFASAT
jgi:hypothetical protein